MNKLKEIFNNILASLDNETKGYSSKKLTALTIILLVCITHIKWIMLGDFSQLEIVLTIDFTFIATMFGINEYGKKKSEN
jgi:hypothetical protein